MADEQENLKTAHEAYLAACQVCDTANREKTACLNNLNNAQKEYDKALTKFVSQYSARGSDWDNTTRKFSVATDK